ncbi:MAG: DUF4173 domain-containing protein [Flavobacteriales bacterium]
MEITKSKIKIAAFVALTIAFNFLFWMEKPGVNYVIYGSLFLGLLIYLDPQKIKNKYSLVSLAGLLVSMISVLLVNSNISVVMFFVSAVLFVSFYYQNELKSLYYILPDSVVNLFFSISELFAVASLRSQNTSSVKKLWKWTKILVIPVSITLVFFFIYFRSNHFIEDYTVLVFKEIGEYLKNIFEHYPFLRFVMMFLGAVLACFFVFYKSTGTFLGLDEMQSDDICRDRIKSPYSFPIHGLRIEYRTALVTLMFLNALLLLVNAVDVWKVWISFDYTQGSSYSAQLHKGIYLLILSILLSIGMLVYFFRGNINFLKNNKTLRVLSHAWLAQNICLAFTAFLKCIHYINYYSLTYKRIGVLIFLLLTIFGLAMMFFKIEKRKSLFFLLRSNSWFIYLFFVGASLVNWDASIAQYNIAHTEVEVVDYRYILSLSDKALPALIEDKKFHLQNLEYSPDTAYAEGMHITTSTLPAAPIEIYPITDRVKHYLNVQDNFTFLSWNYSDDYLVNYFHSKGYKSRREVEELKK